jgi:hypothetical protein
MGFTACYSHLYNTKVKFYKSYTKENWRVQHNFHKDVGSQVSLHFTEFIILKTAENIKKLCNMCQISAWRKSFKFKSVYYPRNRIKEALKECILSTCAHKERASTSTRTKSMPRHTRVLYSIIIISIILYIYRN